MSSRLVRRQLGRSSQAPEFRESVSFYKGIGALPGCYVAGPADLIAEVQEWRPRMGGTLFGLWPNAAPALSCLRRGLPLMSDASGHLRSSFDGLLDPGGGAGEPVPTAISQ